MIDIVMSRKRALRRWSARVGLGMAVAAVAVLGLEAPASAAALPAGATTDLTLSQPDPSSRQVHVTWTGRGVTWGTDPQHQWEVVVTPPSGTLFAENTCTAAGRPDGLSNDCAFLGGVDGVYTVAVTAKTTLGRSSTSASRTLMVVQDDASPGVPRSLKVVPGTEKLVVSWQAPERLGNGVIGYHLDIYDPDDSWVDECDTTTQLTCTFDGLTAGAPYVVEIWANGPGDTSSNTVYSVPTKPLGPVTSTPIPPTVPSSAGTLTASHTSVTPNQSVTISGTGFAAGIPIEVVVYSTPQVLTTVTTDGTGSFSTTVAIPAGLTGSHTLVAGGVGPDGVLRYLTVPVTAANSGGTAGGVPVSGTAGGLPVTGLSLPKLVATAVLILVFGVVLVRFTRRRSVSTPTAVDGRAHLH